MKIGYHASQEQFSPAELLSLVQLAEQAGFQSAMSSEHLTPWSVNQGHSGFTWAWLGAAMQATRQMQFGALAIPCGWRYHPAIVAHAFATLAQMFPDRLPWVAVGSGEAMNEHITGEEWPDKETRNQRLKAGSDIIRALWRGETVTTAAPIKTHEAKLWSLPEKAPKIYGAALSVKTAHWMGGWADGLITVNKPKAELQKIIEAFRQGGGAGKPIVLQMHLSYAAEVETARANAHHQWRNNLISPDKLAGLIHPHHFDRAAESITKDDLDDGVFISSDAAAYIDRLQDYEGMGFSEIYLHNVGKNQQDYISFFGRSVLPEFNRG